MVGKHTRAPKQIDQEFDINTSYREYETIDADICENISYRDLCDLKHKYSLKEGNIGAQSPHNFDLIHKEGILIIPPFDGSAKSMARDWVHSLETYL
jgi:hypothetical protein